MAISRSHLKLTGRFDFLTFYKVGEQIRIRMRKPLDRRRVLKSPEFKNTRMYAGRMARASKIGSRVYQSLPGDFRQFWMYRAFVGEAMNMLKQETMKDEEVFNVLWKTYAEVWQIKAAQQKIEQDNSVEATLVQQPASVQLSLCWNKKDNLPAAWNRETFPVLRSPGRKYESLQRDIQANKWQKNHPRIRGQDNVINFDEASI